MRLWVKLSHYQLIFREQIQILLGSWQSLFRSESFRSWVMNLSPKRHMRAAGMRWATSLLRPRVYPRRACDASLVTWPGACDASLVTWPGSRSHNTNIKCMRIYMYMYVCIHPYIPQTHTPHVYMYTHTHTHTHTQTYTHTHAHTHTRTHTRGYLGCGHTPCGLSSHHIHPTLFNLLYFTLLYFII